jgi:hypothetical protein
MKPNFALKLSNDGIELLHRDPSGWLSLGSVSFETDDVEAGCARLVAEARRLEPGGLRTKLVLPESQLRYATILAPGPTDEARRYQIEAEIEALTPYSADELAYDWSVEDDYALVVVCARETLAEAEQFADASGFNPIAFVAAPESGQFAGEPNFGLTTVAAAYVPAGDRVQFDAEPVRVAGKARPVPRADSGSEKTAAKAAPFPEPEPEQTAREAEAQGAKRPDPLVAAKPDTPSARPDARGATVAAAQPDRPRVEAQPRPADRARPAQAPAQTPAQTSAPKSPAAPIEPLAKVGNLVRRMGTRLRREQAQDSGAFGAKPVVKPVVAPVDRQAPPSGPATGPAPKPAGPATGAALPAPRGAASGTTTGAGSGAATARPSLGAAARPAPRSDVRPSPGTAIPAGAARPAAGLTSLDAKAAEPPVKTPAEAPVAFASRRRPVPEVAASGDGLAPGAATPGGRLAVMGAKQAKAEPDLATRLKRRLKRTQRAVLARVPGMSPAEPGTGRRMQPAAGRQGQTAPSGAIVPASRPPASERDKAIEAEALTIFGARGNIPAAPSLARRGLMAAGGVLLLLVAVAVWVLYFSGEDQTTQMAQGDPVATQAMPQIAAPDQLDPATDISAPTALNALPDNSGVTDTGAPDAADAGAQTDAPDLAPDLALDSGADPADAAGDSAGDLAGDSGAVGDGALADAAGTTTAPAPAPQAAADAGAVADPDRLLESLVQEALTQALPDVALDQADAAATAAAAATATAADAVADTATGAATATAAAQATPQSGTAQASAAAATPEGASDTPQVAAGVATTNPRLSLPAGIEVPAVDEVAFTPPPPPPPFGTEFTFNDDGLVEATPEGALTPSGVTVFAGRPDVVPAVRPAGIAPEQAASEPPAPAEPVAAPAPVDPAAATAATDPADVVFDDTPRADPALAAARPQPRSARVRAIGEQLAPAAPEPEPEPAEPQTQQDAAADPAGPDTAALETPPPGGVSLAGFRPQTRPTDLVPPAGAADSTAPDDATTAATAAVVVDDADATPEAVVASLIPSARPSDVSERAQAALAAARARTAASADAGQAGATDLEDDEGETASAAAQPAIPSSASVARQATETDAINLRDVNLIGVFGTPEDRRALVRLSSGRVVRVQVGDRVDGGQVTAIGENELRYTKNGRNEVLEIGG